MESLRRGRFLTRSVGKISRSQTLNCNSIQQAGGRTYFAADGDHELSDGVTIINHQRLHGTIEHLHSKDTVFLLVLQQVLANRQSQIFNPLTVYIAR